MRHWWVGACVTGVHALTSTTGSHLRPSTSICNYGLAADTRARTISATQSIAFCVTYSMFDTHVTTVKCIDVQLQVMRVHAFVVRKLPAYTASSSSSSFAPAGQQALAQAVPRSMPGHLASQLPLLRQQAVSLLAAPLAGDLLAAEYLLLTALGSVSNSCSSSLLVLNVSLDGLLLLDVLVYGYLCFPLC